MSNQWPTLQGRLAHPLTSNAQAVRQLQASGLTVTRAALNAVKRETKMWKPRPSDIEWTRQHIDSLNHNGLWGIPMNNSVWRLDKVQRVFRCVVGSKDDMFDKITECCKALGYTTELKLEPLPPTQITEAMRGTGKTYERPSA